MAAEEGPGPKPSRQVCQVCAYSDDVEVLRVDDVWIMRCNSDQHLPYEWQPKDRGSALTYRNGIAEEHGVYDTLLDCVDGTLAEYGVIEHRFQAANRKTYDWLVDRYGHRSLAPSKYTASSFLGGALGQLWREGAVEGLWVPATGYWKYNGQIGAYGAEGVDLDGPVLSWQSFATDSLGVSPLDWPPLGFTGAEQET